ncbi:MAG: cytochrome c3 family protein [Desulfobacterales bacterium]|nr:cytochrome c3 family protein [Desulfobacterales bacterium]
MKRLIIGLAVAGMLLVAPLLAVANNGPAKIDLKAKFGFEGKKAAVIFPHAEHQANNKCTDCHKDANGGALKVTIEKKKGSKNDFHVKLCFPCHKAKKVPKGKSCRTCHKKKK